MAISEKPDVIVQTPRGGVPITHAGVTWLLRACLLEDEEGLTRTREVFATAVLTVKLPQAEIERFRDRLDESLKEYTSAQRESPALVELEQLLEALRP